MYDDGAVVRIFLADGSSLHVIGPTRHIVVGIGHRFPRCHQAIAAHTRPETAI